MARNNRKNEVENETVADAPAAAAPTAFALKYKDWAIDPTSESDTNDAIAMLAQALAISPKGVAYLLQNGFTQSLTDAAAFGKDDKDGMTADEIAAMAVSARNERFDDIVAGSVGTRVGGTRVSGVDKVARDMAIEELRAIAAARKAKLPTKADELNPLIERHMAKHGARIKAAAQTKVDMLTALGAELAEQE